MIFQIANCRGKKPVISDIKKALRLLSNAKFEMNDCKGKRIITKAIDNIEDVLKEDDPDIKIYKY
jgi:hypothetical protein